MSLETATTRLKDLLAADEQLQHIDIIENNYGLSVDSSDVGDILANKGLAIVIYVFGVANETPPHLAHTICAIRENPQQRESYLKTLPADAQEGAKLRTLQVVSRIMSVVRKNRQACCGLPPITLAKNPSERILVEGGMLQFDVRTLVPFKTD